MRDTVYIVYHRSDQRWAESLFKHFKPQIRADIKIFDPYHHVHPGDETRSRKNEALHTTRVAMVLVSKDFLADDDLVVEVLVPLIEAQKQNDIILLWLLVSPCLYEYSVLRALEPAHKPDEPLASLTEAQAESILVKICRIACNHIGIHANNSISTSYKNGGSPVNHGLSFGNLGEFSRQLMYVALLRDIAILVTIIVVWLQRC